MECNKRSGVNCMNCMFGVKAIRINRKKANGDDNETMSEVFECRRKTPTGTYGFVVVRPDDFCAYHTNQVTGALTFRDILREAPINPA